MSHSSDARAALHTFFTMLTQWIAPEFVWLDAGHGGHDPGAVGFGGLREKDVTLDVCLRIKAVLEAAGVQVGMSRVTDVFVPLWERTSMANAAGAAIFVSIHCNSAKQAASGIETLHAGSSKGKVLAQRVQDGMLDARPDGIDRGLKERKDLAVLKNTAMPACLAELEFIHTEAGAALMQDEEVLQAYAENIAYSLLGKVGAKKLEKLFPLLPVESVPGEELFIAVAMAADVAARVKCCSDDELTVLGRYIAGHAEDTNHGIAALVLDLVVVEMVRRQKDDFLPGRAGGYDEAFANSAAKEKGGEPC